MSAPLFLLKRLGFIKQSISHHNSLGEKWGVAHKFECTELWGENRPKMDEHHGD